MENQIFFVEYNSDRNESSYFSTCLHGMGYFSINKITEEKTILGSYIIINENENKIKNIHTNRIPFSVLLSFIPVSEKKRNELNKIEFNYYNEKRS